MKTKNNNRLNELRTEKGLKQSELADIVGSSQQTISNYERGYISALESSVEEALANYFSCSLDYLRGLSDIKNPEEYIDSAVLLKKEFIKLGIIKENEDISDEQLSLFRDLLKANKPFFERISKLTKKETSDENNETDKTNKQ